MSLVQNPAPDFTATAVVDGDFKSIKLSEHRGQWVYLFFYPLDFTFVCPTEIIAFSDANEKFKAMKTQILGCSVDSKYVHLKFIETSRKDGGLGGCAYPLVADLSKEIARSYDVLAGDKSLRGSFIIDPKGVVRQATINDLPVGRSVDEALRLIEAFQYTEAHSGEVCPANWTRGSDTMKESPKGAKEYFKQKNA